jgi:DNA polymerase III epsilon subunit-like protein
MEPALVLRNSVPDGYVPRRDIPRPELPQPLRAIAFVDIETTGLDPSRHDILEVAVVRVDARSLEVLSEYSSLVTPERIEEADPEALAICGFTRAGWTHAVPLFDALVAVARHLDGTLVAGHNVGFDWAFLQAGFQRTGLTLPPVDYRLGDYNRGTEDPESYARQLRWIESCERRAA